MIGTHTWGKHTFNIYKMSGAAWNDVGGVYIFAGSTGPNSWEAYYIGTCDSFQYRCPNHERWTEAVRFGATHVHAMSVPLEADREAIEQELIGLCRPPLNLQHR